MEIEVEKLEVKNNTQRKRFEVELGEYDKAYIDYRKVGDRYTLVHTEVPQQYAGKGIADRLARGALALIEAEGAMISVTCPYLTKWLKRHPDYDSLMARKPNQDTERL